MTSLPDPTTLLAYALAFLRVGGILFALPVIGDPPTPVRVRAFLALALTAGMAPLIQPGWAPRLDADVVVIAAYVVKELLIGLVIGYLARLAFDGVLMAAGIVAYQMGFGTGSLFIPDFGGPLDAFSAFHRLIVVLLFFGLGLHYVFIGAIADSFRILPGGVAALHQPLGSVLVTTTAGLLATALQLAAPILVAILFTTAALGIASRTVPQLNVFVISFPLSFVVGLTVYIATLPFYPEWLREHFSGTRDDLLTAMRALAG